ncbi:MAG: DUF4139 domain-containing protein [Fimbriimonadaceae bacterium]
MSLTFIAGALILASQPTSVEVTVYNQGFGLVKEVRRIELKAGRQEIAVEDVAAMIQPTSVGIRSLDPAKTFDVLEQNYQYDLISVQAILNKAVGQQIKFVRTFDNGRKEVVEGVLLSAPTAIVTTGGSGFQPGVGFGGTQQTYNGMVIRTADGRILLNPVGEVEVSSIPEGMISKPTLLWDVQTQTPGPVNVELSYISNGLTWNADYVMTLGVATNVSDFRGWVTLDNQSGVTYKDATLKLLAGDVNLAPAPTGRGGGGFGGAMAMEMAAKGFQEESLFEYHLYTLQRPSTIRNRETKQLSLLEGDNVRFTKRIILDSMIGWGVYYPSEGEVGTGPLKPQVRVEFDNTKENGLGVPLPMGKVVVYQRDQSGSVQMLGEDRIQHTPQGERVSLVVGRSFDIVGERKRTNFRRLGPSMVEESFEISVRNRKKEPETVYVYERRYGDWNVTQTSMPFTKLDANTMSYEVRLQPDEERKITYTVTTRW